VRGGQKTWETGAECWAWVARKREPNVGRGYGPVFIGGTLDMVRKVDNGCYLMNTAVEGLLRVC
jgi:hypothetical protein